MLFPLFKNVPPSLFFQMTFSSHFSDLTLNATFSGRASLTIFSKLGFSFLAINLYFIIAFIMISHYFYLLFTIYFF